MDYVDYKDTALLRRFVSDRGKIRARRVSGNCAQHQREVAVAIKTARELALLPYTQRATAERGLGRGRRDGPVGGPPEAPAAVPDEAEAVELNGEGEPDADAVLDEGALSMSEDADTAPVGAAGPDEGAGGEEA